MARIPYAARDAAAARPLFDRLKALRGKPVENVFLAIANVPALCDGVLAMAMSLRQSTLLDRQLRELVGLERQADYEVADHWNSAVKPTFRTRNSTASPISRRTWPSPKRNTW